MTEEFQVLYLPPDLADHVEVLDLLPIEDLDGDLVAGELVEADLDLAEGADPQCLTQDVVTDLHLHTRPARTAQD